jgi:toxin ParE1/3/4
LTAIRYSQHAEADLMSIGEYTLRTWSASQAEKYLAELEACCLRLADHPLLGRACDEIRPGLRRMEQGRHVVFYRRETKGIFVSRILHRSMLPERQEMEGALEDTSQDPPG